MAPPSPYSQCEPTSEKNPRHPWCTSRAHFSPHFSPRTRQVTTDAAAEERRLCGQQVGRRATQHLTPNRLTVLPFHASSLPAPAGLALLPPPPFTIVQDTGTLDARPLEAARSAAQARQARALRPNWAAVQHLPSIWWV